MPQKGVKLTQKQMKDRIRQIMEAQHMTQQVLASYIGTTPATLSGIFNDRTRPTINIIESIKKKFPDISLEWLMFGEGEMFKQSSDTPDAPLTSAYEGAGLPKNGQEQLIDFDQPVVPTPQNSRPTTHYSNSVRMTRPEILYDEGKIVDKTVRRVTEIRVYYDDQTWESFVPAKK